MISKKQKDIYDFIVSYAKDYGYAPSLEEIAENFSFLYRFHTYKMKYIMTNKPI